MAVSAVKKSPRPIAFLVTWASIFYALTLAGVLYGLDHCTQGQWYFGALLYLPAEGWLLPLVVLLPLAFMVRPSVCILHAAAAAAVYFGYLDAHSLGQATRVDGATPLLTVITANLGQRRADTLQPFLDAHDADIVAFQERLPVLKTFVAFNPDYQVRQEGEFLLATRLPIRSSGLVPDLTFEGRPVAAWFELEYQHRSVVVYSVHMPTPRSYLFELRGRGLAAGVFSAGGLLDPAAREDYKYYWTMRFVLAQGLLAVLDKEKRPLLVVGDFNTPDHGGIYREFASHLVDTYAVVGSGSGGTFPGNTRGKLAGLGPWLRLDYLFAGRQWRPVDCAVEADVRAQHLAVVGRFELMDRQSIPARLAASARATRGSGLPEVAAVGFLVH